MYRPEDRLLAGPGIATPPRANSGVRRIGARQSSPGARRRHPPKQGIAHHPEYPERHIPSPLAGGRIRPGADAGQGRVRTPLAGGRGTTRRAPARRREHRCRPGIRTARMADPRCPGSRRMAGPVRAGEPRLVPLALARHRRTAGFACAGEPRRRSRGSGRRREAAAGSGDHGSGEGKAWTARRAGGEGVMMESPLVRAPRRSGLAARSHARRCGGNRRRS